MRGLDDGDAGIWRAIALIDRAFGRSRLAADAILLHGIGGDHLAHLRSQGLAVGQVLRFDGYLSASPDVGAARLYAAWPPGGMILRIFAKSGIEVTEMSRFSDYPDERELLLPRGCGLRLIKLDEPGWIDVEVSE